MIDLVYHLNDIDDVVDLHAMSYAGGDDVSMSHDDQDCRSHDNDDDDDDDLLILNVNEFLSENEYENVFENACENVCENVCDHHATN